MVNGIGLDLAVICGDMGGQATRLISDLRGSDPVLPMIVYGPKGIELPNGDCRIAAVPIDSQPGRIIDAIRDLSDRDRSFLLRRRRMKGDPAASTGFYIDIITHDMDNLGQGIMGYLELLLLLPETTDQQRKYIQDSIALLRLNQSLLGSVRKDFSAPEKSRPQNLREVSREVSRNIQSLNPLRRIDIDVSSVPQGIKVMGSDLLPDLFLQLMDFMVQRSEGNNRFKITAELDGSGSKVNVNVLCGGRSLNEDHSRSVFRSADEGAMMGKLNICKRIAGRLGGDVEYMLSSGDAQFTGGMFKVELKVVQ